MPEDPGTELDPQGNNTGYILLSTRSFDKQEWQVMVQVVIMLGCMQQR